MKRIAALFACVGAASAIFGQAQELPLAGIPVTGKLYYINLSNPGDRLPLKAQYVFPFVVGTGDPTISIDIWKTHSWDGSQVNDITDAITCDIGSFPSSGGERNIDILPEFYDAIDTLTGNDRFGRWELRFTHYSSGSPSGQIVLFSFQLTNLSSYDAAGKPLTELFGGDVPGGTAATDNPGFWEGLFVPSREALDNLSRGACNLVE